MPIVAGIGGNSGNQTITMIVRAVALGQVTREHARTLIRKEIIVALINGARLGRRDGHRRDAAVRDVALGLVMVLAMTLNLHARGADGRADPDDDDEARAAIPAVGSSVLITAVTDSGGFFIFLGLATLFLVHH